MTRIVNLSTIHQFSVNLTLDAFFELCNQYSKGCLQSMPGIFQRLTNHGWVMMKFKLNAGSLIQRYKSGQMSTEDFLKGLSDILYFMEDVKDKDLLLKKAWNASIKLDEETQDRFSQLVETATKEDPVFFVSNTNPLNVEAILDLFKGSYPSLENVDIGVEGSKGPIEILPNVYLCLSYRYGCFKTDGLVEQLKDYLATNHPGPVTLVSQYPGDLETGRSLGFANVVDAKEYYPQSNSSSKKFV